MMHCVIKLLTKQTNNYICIESYQPYVEEF